MAFGIKSPADGKINFEVVPTTSNTTVSINDVNGIPAYGDSPTGAMIFPSGSTAQRTSSPSVGAIRWNTTLGINEIWNGYNWGNIVGKLPSTYRTNRSLRTRSSASAYLSRTPASSSSQSRYTFSFWVKRGSLGSNQTLLSCYAGSSTYQTYMRFNSSDKLEFYSAWGTDVQNLITTQVFRDTNSWYHIIFAINMNASTVSDAIQIYVNGNIISSFSTSTFTNAFQATAINSTYAHNINRDVGTSSSYFDGYLTEVNFINGLQLTPPYFGEVDVISGSWIPKAYTGTYGTNGFYLPFTDNSALTTSSNVGLGKDFSGNTNYWVTNNISITAGVTYDSMLDVPTLTSATVCNYAVLNRLVSRQYGGSGFGTYTDGNLKAAWTSGGETFQAFASIEITPLSPKVYWEVKNLVIGDSGNYPLSGIANANQTSSSTNTTWFLTSGAGVGVYASGYVYNGGTALTSVTAPGATGVLGFAYDPYTGKFWVAINGVWQNSGNPATGVNPTATLLTSNNWVPVMGNYGGSPQSSSAINFGQQPFNYTPPTGFVALNTYNLP